METLCKDLGPAFKVSIFDTRHDVVLYFTLPIRCMYTTNFTGLPLPLPLDPQHSSGEETVVAIAHLHHERQQIKAAV